MVTVQVEVPEETEGMAKGTGTVMLTTGRVMTVGGTVVGAIVVGTVVTVVGGGTVVGVVVTVVGRMNLHKGGKTLHSAANNRATRVLIPAGT
jgi:hypothetical protein